MLNATFIFFSICPDDIEVYSFFQRDGERSIVYNTVGPNVCMGDHKVTVKSNMYTVLVNKPAV